jgi:hypothetical protein
VAASNSGLQEAAKWTENVIDLNEKITLLHLANFKF